MPVLEGATFARVEQRRADLRFPLPPNFAKRLEGRRVERLRRRAKYLLAELDDGETLAMHLGMSGRFIVGTLLPADASKNRNVLGEFTHETGGSDKHDHIVFEMSNFAVIRYNDTRRFGYMDLIGPGELAAHPLFRDLGIEPLGPELDAAYLAAKAAGRRTPLKSFLLDQRIIAGLGNIYVCEALFRAGLDPAKGAARLATRGGRPTPVAERLAAAIKAVLADAIRAGGSSLRDHRQADGELGYFQHSFRVYDRAGQPCVKPGCGGTVRRIVQNGRSTFYCPACQH